MSGKFTNDKMECMCAKVPENASMLILSPTNVVLGAYHRDCPEHGWSRRTKKEMAVKKGNSH